MKYARRFREWMKVEELLYEVVTTTAAGEKSRRVAFPRWVWVLLILGTLALQVLWAILGAVRR